jgi:hypothetical protein
LCKSSGPAFLSGSVWRGRYEGTAVAVKKSLAAGFKAQMDQMDEIKLLAGLPPHPHVLQVTGAYLEENAVCSVSPFMPGGTRAGVCSVAPGFECVCVL